jgi:acyl-CoA thioester hydrolase
VTVTSWRVRVAYADTDQGGVVHHGTYLRYLECGRVEHMRERGFDYRALEERERLGLLVVEANVRYKLPARFDDVLELRSWIGLGNRAKLRFDTQILRGDDVLTEAQITLACVHMERARIVSMPAGVLALADATVAKKI